MPYDDLDAWGAPDDDWEPGDYSSPLDIVSFRWQTADGQLLTLAEMETKHIFNSMKMCFNHLAEAHGGRPVWFKQQYLDYQARARVEPETLVWLIVFFCEEIIRRGDLPPFYQKPFDEIWSQVCPINLPGQRPSQPAGPHIYKGV